ncbi:MAG TPA: trypsin-like serine protease [Kofleriaceae bacterium]|nr:trypsin-like serine protease [Kofleriaceae bacterium]
MPRILAVSLLAFASTASAQTTGTRDTVLEPDNAPVIGGTAVPTGKWPDAVAVLGPQGSCTGTLIAPDVVLTAGHCAEVAPTRVVADTTDYNAAGGTTANVKSITAYPNWETQYDVSVIVLASPITSVPPRKIGTSCTFDTFAANTQVHLVGFGLTDTAGTGDNTQLNEAMAPVTDPDCSGGNGCMSAIAPGGEFIAGGGGTDSCFGDSGGPVYLDTARGTVVIGAVSRGLDNAATPCGGGGIYVRTDKIVQWIESTAGHPVEKDLCAAGPGEGSGSGSGSGSGDDNDGGDGDRFGDSDISGGCAAGGGSTGIALAFAIGLVARRRRR